MPNGVSIGQRVRVYLSPTGHFLYEVGERLFTMIDATATGLYYLSIPTAAATALYLVPQDAVEAGPYIFMGSLPLVALGAINYLIRRYYPARNPERLIAILARTFPEIFEALTDAANTLLFTWVSALVIAVDVNPDNGEDMDNATLAEYSAIPLALGVLQFFQSLIVRTHRLFLEERVIPPHSYYEATVVRLARWLGYPLAVVQAAATMQDLIRFGGMGLTQAGVNLPPTTSTTTTLRYSASVLSGFFLPTAERTPNFISTGSEVINRAAEIISVSAERSSMYLSALVLAIWVGLSVSNPILVSMFWLGVLAVTAIFVVSRPLPVAVSASEHEESREETQRLTGEGLEL